MKLQSRVVATGVWIALVVGTVLGFATPDLHAQAVTFSPTTTALGIVAIGETSASKVISLKNTGAAALTISSVVSSSSFNQTNNCPASLAVNAACNITVTFSPSATGVITGTVTVTDNAAGSPHTANLQGTGTNPGTFNPTSVAFGAQATGTTSAVKTVSLKNYKTSALTISSIVTTGDYAQTNNCGNSLAAGATCTISVTFKPVATGSRPGTLTANVGSGVNPTATLTGNGVAPFTVNPTSLTFANQAVATTSAAKAVTITNNQAGAVSIGGISVSGDFAQTTTCGATLAAAASCTFSVTFTPTATGTRTGNLGFSVGGISQSVGLSGTGIAQVTVTPASLTFTNQVISTSSAAKTVTVKNNATVALAISGVGITGDFAQTNTCGSSLAASATCTFSVTFTPTAVGSLTGSLAFTAGSSPQTVSLAGTGIAPVTVTPTSLTFANQAVGSTSPGQAVTVKNNQTTALAISGISISPNFAQTTNCPGSLAAGASCTLTVTFKPTVTGALTGTLAFTAAGPQSVALSGSALAPVTVSPLSLAFGNQATQTTSPAQVITVTNNQSTTLTGLSSSVSGIGFARTTTCASSLTAAAHSCTISVTFAPTVVGSSTGTVTINYTGSGSPQTVTLSGTGTNAVVLSPAVLDFGTQSLGLATAAQPITLNNAQNTALTISGIAIVGVTDFTQTNNCGTSLAAKASCTINAVFKPTVASNRVATLTVTDNATGSPHTMALTGTGAVALTLSPTALTFNAQLLNTTSAAQVVTVTNTLATPVTSTVAISGDYQQTNNCASLAAGTSCTVNVTFKPTAAGNRTGTLTINPGGTAQTLSLTGVGSSTAVAVNPTSLAFGNQATATPSAVKTVTLTNSQTSALAITSIATNQADYGQTNTCGSSLAASSSCVISVTLTPSVTGSRPGTLTITTGVSTLNVTMTGNGVVPITLTPASLAMGIQVIGTTSLSKAATLTNNLSTPLTISSIVATTNFGETDNCGTALPAAKSCVINVTFTPTATGVLPGTLTVNHGFTGSPATIPLQGTGTVAATVTPTSLAFGSAAIGTITAAKVVTIRNYQTFPLALTGVVVTGDYSQTNNCGGVVAAGATCTMNVTFSPTTSGSRPGNVSITVDAASVSPLLFTMTGSGVLPQASVLPVALSFGLQAVSTTSPTQTVTVKNNLATTMTIASIVPAGDFTVGATTCGASLAGNQTCAVDVAFAPTVAGVRAGTLTITDSANNSPQVVTLSGTATLQAASIAVTPASVSLGIGGQQQYQAIATFPDSSTMDVTSSATWASGNPSIASITSSGLATVLSESATAIPITATFEGVSNAANPSWLSALTVLPPSCPTPQLDLKLLVVTNGKGEAQYPAITQILDYLGTPYTAFDFADPVNAAGITSALLTDPSNSCHGFYNGVIFADGGYIYTLAGKGMPVLTTYEQTFGVRQVNWYTFPTADFGFNPYTAANGNTFSATWSGPAASVFSYLNTTTPLSISNAWTYFATPLVPVAGSGATVTPLLTDASGNAVSLIYNTGGQYPHEMLTQTFATNQFLTHDLVVAYGLIKWVSKGLFLGDYHVYAAAQIDDVFINDAEWVPGTPCISNDVAHDRTAVDATTATFRMNKADVDGLVAWQAKVQQNPLLQTFMLQMAFNGIGTVGNPDWTGLAPGVTDDLVPEFQLYSGNFYWMTHTYDHPETLNGLPQTDPGGDPQPDFIDLEILTNLYVASGTTQGGVNLDRDEQNTVTPLNLQNFNPINMVSPGVTGLNDPLVPTYLYADGIRYVVTDTSVIGQANNGPNPSPNVGIVNSFAPGIYEVPRYPNNIFYNTATWDDLQSEFQCIYSYPTPQLPYNTYTSLDILNFTVNDFVNNMLKGDMNPQMFHQPNLHFFTNNVPGMASNGQSTSLISDVYDATFAKYLSLFKLPVLSLPLDQIGQRMKDRNTYNLSLATATYTGGANPSLTITIPDTATVTSATIPVTGLNSATAEVYGGQNISHVPVTQGTPVTLLAQ